MIPFLGFGMLPYLPTLALCDARYLPTRALCEVGYGIARTVMRSTARERVGYGQHADDHLRRGTCSIAARSIAFCRLAGTKCTGRVRYWSWFRAVVCYAGARLCPVLK
eukprot:2090633-Rhodomonas_salina.2